MDILIGLISGLFWPILIIVFIVWLVKRSSSGPKTDYRVEGSKDFVPAINGTELIIRAKVAAELRAQAAQYKTASQRKVVEDMAQTVEYFAVHSYGETATSAEFIPAIQSTGTEDKMPAPTYVAAGNTTSEVISEQPYETPWRKLQLLDGATILLYLGAFFVLASIGLYVGLGQGSGIKAVLVTLITLIFYIGGIGLYKNSVRLKPAGLTFVAIGMATLPMAGAAAYYFAFDKQHGPLIWLVTSVLAICLYVHAMYVLKSSLVSYMVVFSTLSLVLSSVSSLGVAPYYYIQAMGLAGLLFAICSRLFGTSEAGLDKAYDRSAMFLVPFSTSLAVLLSLRVGWLQLASSLLLAAMYYAYAASISVSNRSIYALLAQLMGIASVIVGSFGISEKALTVALTSSAVTAIYISIWVLWARKSSAEKVYRDQVKYILLLLPYISLIALLGNTDLIWMGMLLLLVTSVLVYVVDRDFMSGFGWLASTLSLPLLVAYLTLPSDPTNYSMGLIYLAIGVLSLALHALNRSDGRESDYTFVQLMLYLSQMIAAGYLFRSNNTSQLVMGFSQVAVFTIWSLLQSDKKYWYMVASLVQCAWLLAFMDDARYFVGGLVSIVVYNLVFVQMKSTSLLHDWLATSALFAIPLTWGIGVSKPEQWSLKVYFGAYAAIFVVLLLVRIIKKGLDPLVCSTGYLTALSVVYVLSFYINPWLGLGISFATVCVLYVSEKLETSSVFGYLAPLVSLGILFNDDRTVKQALIGLLGTTAVLAVCAVVRKRRYEGYLATIGSIVSLWFAGIVVYDLSSTAMMSAYFAMTTVYIAKRFMLRNKINSFSDVLMTGYSVSLGMAFIFTLLTNWETMSIGLFVIGVLLTAISYLESSPPVIIGAFIAGYASILKFCDGNDLSLNATVGILLVLSHATYWVLIISKLATIRARYARGFQLFVAMMIPIVGLGFMDRSIFPASLTMFSLMLAREVWVRGQSSREAAVFLAHISALWWLYTLGVRELQVFTQSTAIVLAGFAFWRRRSQDSPAVINQYLWLAVLTFSLPMAWQAIASSNPAYSYLLLVEHVILIIVSIVLKRATFAWWGIAVTVAAVLYQLRKFRYAALAFLGAFIISLAVYFLLKYNKPEPPK